MVEDLKGMLQARTGFGSQQMEGDGFHRFALVALEASHASR